MNGRETKGGASRDGRAKRWMAGHGTACMACGRRSGNERPPGSSCTGHPLHTAARAIPSTADPLRLLHRCTRRIYVRRAKPRAPQAPAAETIQRQVSRRRPGEGMRSTVLVGGRGTRPSRRGRGRRRGRIVEARSPVRQEAVVSGARGCTNNRRAPWRTQGEAPPCSPTRS